MKKKLGEKIPKAKGCTLKGMKSNMTHFGDKSMKTSAGTVNGGARSKVGKNASIQGGRVDT
jgi:hypothetical protein